MSQNDNPDLWRLDATEIAALVLNGDITAASVTEAHLARIDEIEPDLNAVIYTRHEQARAAASNIDERLARGEDVGALAGVPVTVKLNIDVAGEATTDGVAELADNVAALDSPVVERVRAAGGVIVGRTNLPDAGMRIDTSSSLHGRTRNPWRVGITAGGSSGGEGASLATGMSALGLGNDLGGSLRNPANCNGIASIKPTLGRVPHARLSPGTAPMSDLLIASEGPMARRVADVELGLRVIAGAHPRDPQSQPVPLDPPMPATGRVALLAEVPGVDTDRGVAGQVRAAADALVAAGIDVVEDTPPSWDDMVRCWASLVMGGLDPADPNATPMIVGPDTEQFMGDAITAMVDGELVGPEWGWGRRHQIQAEWADWFSDYDAVLSPIWTQPPFEADADLGSPESALFALEVIRPVLPGNVLGLPSAAVPAGFVDGLPSGALLTGPSWSDLRILQLAHTVEAAFPKASPIDPA